MADKEKNAVEALIEKRVKEIPIEEKVSSKDVPDQAGIWQLAAYSRGGISYEGRS